MYLLIPATRWQSYKSTAARGLWCDSVGEYLLCLMHIHTRTHAHTHLTWASACMKMNSHFLAKALCSRARFSCGDQSEAALEEKVVLNSRPFGWLYFPFNVIMCSKFFWTWWLDFLKASHLHENELNCCHHSVFGLNVKQCIHYNQAFNP